MILLMGSGRKGFGLIAGNSPLWVLNGFCGCMAPVPYVGWTPGALKGWASVLKTSGEKNRSANQLKRERAVMAPTFIKANMLGVVERQIAVGSNGKSGTAGQSSRRTKQAKRHLQVLQNLSEPETLHVVNLLRIHVIHIIDPGKCNSCWKVLVEAGDGAGRPVQVLRVACNAPRIEIRLQDLGT